MNAELLPAIDALSDGRRAETTAAHKARWGQFFTPAGLAVFMASKVEITPGQPIRVLDPGAGSGILGVAVAEAALAAGASAVRLVGVEREPETRAVLARALALASARLGPAFQPELRGEDLLDPPAGPEDDAPFSAFDVVIANPPYFKMSPKDPRGGDAPNAYARFMEVAARRLRPGGLLLFIVPRSFASGRYYQRFRQRFHADMALLSVHLFDSRRQAFRGDRVLQENIVVAYRKGTSPPATVQISSSAGLADLEQRRSFDAPRGLVFLPEDPAGVLYLPGSPRDAETMRAVLSWPARLSGLGLAVSTGPVVPFRTEALRHEAGPDTAPLLWMQHVHPGEIRWPLGVALRKPEHIGLDLGQRLLVPNQRAVLLRRFSAKEARRRLTVAVLEEGRLPGAQLGLENHLNLIHRPGGALEPSLAYGLAALLSSTLIDDFFRIQSGNTQVSATEIRALPLPERARLERLGEAVRAAGPGVVGHPERADPIVAEILLS